jgi:leader peptidase (prepilin peptidase)/N-methyltransferase
VPASAAAADPLATEVAGLFAALVGACIGSFLNVVIARVPEGESIVSPGSRCPSCRTPIAWYDNLPVLSWLVLRGRCRSCGAPISPRYLGVELLGGAAAVAAWWRHGLGAAAALELAFVAFLIALSAIDLDRWELPHELTRPLLALGLVASAFSASAAPSLRSSALGAGVGFAAFWLVMKVGALLAKQEAMGVGDVWLLAGLGAWLGWAALLPVVMLASIQGSVVGIALVVAGKAQKGREGEAESSTPTATPTPTSTPPSTGQSSTSTSTEGEGVEDEWVPPRNAVPFGPFLAVGALEWLYAGDLLARLVAPLQIFR